MLKTSPLIYVSDVGIGKIEPTFIDCPSRGRALPCNSLESSFTVGREGVSQHTSRAECYDT